VADSSEKYDLLKEFVWDVGYLRNQNVHGTLVGVFAANKNIAAEIAPILLAPPAVNDPANPVSPNDFIITWVKKTECDVSKISIPED